MHLPPGRSRGEALRVTSSGAVDCPFCARIAAADLIVSGDGGAVLEDAFPVSPGHLLVVPLRHEPDFFSLTGEEQGALVRLVGQARTWISERHRPDGFNVGINVGSAAGQTVGHAHIHVIPRYAGDAADPRGGVRWVLPERAAYWRT